MPNFEPLTPLILAQKCGRIIGLRKKYILDNFDNQKQGIPTFSFQAAFKIMILIWLGLK